MRGRAVHLPTVFDSRWRKAWPNGENVGKGRIEVTQCCDHLIAAAILAAQSSLHERELIRFQSLDLQRDPRNREPGPTEKAVMPASTTTRPDLVVFNIVIPRTDDRTGIVHAPRRFRDWLLETAARFGGVSVVGINLRGLWFDPAASGGTAPVEDHSNWYKVGVAPSRLVNARVHGEQRAVRPTVLYLGGQARLSSSGIRPRLGGSLG
jgi:hypothetical protein